MEVADYVPDCAVAGVQYGAGLGAVAGGLSGAAALTGSGIRSVNICRAGLVLAVFCASQTVDLACTEDRH